MAFLFIQNHAIEVADGEASMRRVSIGDAAQAFTGAPLTSERAIRYEWPFTTTPMPPEEALFLMALLGGEGHKWDFDNGNLWWYSSKGLNADDTTGLSRHTATTKFGGGALAIAAGQAVTWDVGYNFEWTVMLWKGAAGGGSFPDHIIVNSAGAKYQNGVRNDALSTPYIAVSGGAFTLGDTGSAVTQYFDDVVIIPADITDAWAEDLGTMATAFGDCPRIRVRGDMFWGGRIYSVQGFDVSAKYVQGVYDGTWYPNLMTVSAYLRQFSRVS